MRRVSQGREGGEVDDGRGLKILSVKKEPRYKKKKETIGQGEAGEDGGDSPS